VRDKIRASVYFFFYRAKLNFDIIVVAIYVLTVEDFSRDNKLQAGLYEIKLKFAVLILLPDGRVPIYKHCRYLHNTADSL